MDAKKAFTLYLFLLFASLVITDRLFPTQTHHHPEIVVYEAIGLGVVFSLISWARSRKGKKKEE